MVTGDIPISDFSSSAAAAARWTQETISEETMAYLRGLKPSDPGREPALYHASPRDPVWEYVLSTWQADECIDLMDARVGAVGHSHVALWFSRDDEGKIVGGAPPRAASRSRPVRRALAREPRRRRPATRW